MAPVRGLRRRQPRKSDDSTPSTQPSLRYITVLIYCSESRPRLASPVFTLELAQEILGADEVIVENPARDTQQIGDERVTQDIPDAHAFFSAGHDVRGTQYRKLLRHYRLVNAKSFLQLLDALLTLDEQLEDPNPYRVCQGLEERSLERLEFVSRDFIHISIFYSTDPTN
jgi:hypothetical protein